MFLKQIWLTNFRNYAEIDCSFESDGLTVISGSNGHGKTNLLEAIGFVATLKSFRGATPESLVRAGEELAVIRGLGERAGRELLIESELHAGRRGKTLINKQSLQKVADLQDLLAITVFAPDDLDIVKSGPAIRRQLVDGLLADRDREAGAVQRDLDRILKQRNTLLRQAGGRMTKEIELTLDVWDSKLAQAGEKLGELRQQLVEELQPRVAAAYEDLAAESKNTRIGMRMVTDWRVQDGGKGLAEALIAVRKTDLGRQVTTVGPHRDELALTIAGMPARTHASQGEQRTLTLALRLAGHRLMTDHSGSAPILILDDVFSELDEDRARRLVRELPQCQTFLSTASGIPSGLQTSGLIEINEGRVVV